MLHLALGCTTLLLVALLLLGLRLQVGLKRGRRNDQARWPHHALFFAVCAADAWAIFCGWQQAGRWWALLPSLALLLSMPLTRPGRANHWQRALAVAVAFAGGCWLLW